MASCPQLTIRNQPPDFIARSLNGINTQHLTTYSLSEGKGTPAFSFGPLLVNSEHIPSSAEPPTRQDVKGGPTFTSPHRPQRQPRLHGRNLTRHHAY
jgi:hypothetical protein